MKALLDGDLPEEQTKLESLVVKEAAEFTDFLNFFELVAYLKRVGTLSTEDVDALLGYYLDKLRENGVVWSYIRRTSKSFENLRRMLIERPLE